MPTNVGHEDGVAIVPAGAGQDSGIGLHGHAPEHTLGPHGDCTSGTILGEERHPIGGRIRQLDEEAGFGLAIERDAPEPCTCGGEGDLGRLDSRPVDLPAEEA